MLGKGHHPQLHHDSQLVFQDTHALAETMAATETVDSGHGRIEQRRLTVSAALIGYSDWPGLAHVFQIERRVTMKKQEEQRHEVVYGVTSLGSDRAGPERLLRLVRQHWSIENQSHGVRDVTFDADRSQVRCGSIPQVMAACCNTAMGVIRCAAQTNGAAACRRFAAQPWAGLALIGIIPEH